ncbi:MAG: DsbA family protein [Parachlamydiaceae bacterium]
MAILKVPIGQEDHMQGSQQSLVNLVEYGDYECPFCGLTYLVVKQLQKHYQDKLRFVFRHFPLTEIHPLAEIAAESAEFAASKGKFWEMHDLIYEHQKQLTAPFLLELAESLELSPLDLELAIKAQAFQPKIKSDFLGGVRSGVNGTPTFYINENRYDGSYETKDFIRAIDDVFAKSAC